MSCSHHCERQGCTKQCVGNCDDKKTHSCEGIHYCNELCSCDTKTGGYCDVIWDDNGSLRPAQRRCRRIILPNEECHSGLHKCTLEATDSHLCCVPCPMCRHPCLLKYNHSGKHQTQHGVVSIPHISPDDRNLNKLTCKDMCLSLGEGHCHYVSFGTGITPSEDMLGFDLTDHNSFWSKWNDPCEETDHQIVMSQCRQQCQHCTEPSGCSLGVLHSGCHSFYCTHSKNIIFLIDYSKSSEEDNKISQIRNTVSSVLSHRAACTDVYSTVLFNTRTVTTVERKRRSEINIKKQTSDNLPEGGTKYSLGLEKAKQIISGVPKKLKSASVVILISDGKSSKRSGIIKPVVTAHNSIESELLDQQVPIHCVELSAKGRFYSKMIRLAELTGGTTVRDNNLTPMLDALDCSFDPGRTEIKTSISKNSSTQKVRKHLRRLSMTLVSVHTPGFGFKSEICDVSLIDAEVSYIRTLTVMLSEKHSSIKLIKNNITEIISIHSSLLGVYRAHTESNLFVGVLKMLESLSSRIVSVYSEYISSFQRLVESVSDNSNLQLLVTAPVQRLPKFKLSFSNSYRKCVKNKKNSTKTNNSINEEDDEIVIKECEEKVRELLLAIEGNYRRL